MEEEDDEEEEEEEVAEEVAEEEEDDVTSILTPWSWSLTWFFSLCLSLMFSKAASLSVSSCQQRRQ